MARFIYVAGSDIASSVRFPNGFTNASAAEQGTVSIGNIEIDDPTGALDLKNLNPAYIVETAASPTRLWTGYLYNLVIDRGPYLTGPGRVWRADCVDVNSLLTRRIVLSSNGNRGIESDLTRLTWLLGNPVLSGLVASGAYTNLSTNSKNLDAANYYWQTPMEVLADIAPQCGKVAFAFYNPSTAAVELFYDTVTASTYDSTAKISNVFADVGAGVYSPYKDGSMERVGENLASKAVLRWVGGVTTQENLTTKSTYGEMTYTWDSSRIGRATTAATQVAAILSNKSLPDETVTCRVLLPPANVNDILEGQRIQVKFSHLPGLTSYTYMRVIRRAVAVDDSDNYLVQLTLSNKVRPPLGGGPGVGGFPTPPASAPSLVQKKQALNNNVTSGITLDATPTPGDLLVAVVGWRGTTSAPSILTGFTQVSSTLTVTADCIYMAYRIVQAGDTATFSHASTSGKEHVIDMSEWSGTWSSPVNTSATNTGTGVAPTATVTPTAGQPAVIIGGALNYNDNTPTDTNYVAGSGFTLLDQGNVPSNRPLVGSVDKIVTSTTGSYSPNLSATAGYGAGTLSTWGEIAAVFVPSSGGVVLPLPGQWVYQETPTPTPDGTTTTFTVAYPFADGSLRVYVDLTDQTGAVTSYDGAAGTFVLGFAPKVGEKVTVDYQGR